VRHTRPVVVLEGGLGNQLFQYAFALHVAGGEVVLDDRRRYIWGSPLASVLKPRSWRPVRQSELLMAWQCPRVPAKQRSLDKAWTRVFHGRMADHLVDEARASGEVDPIQKSGVVMYAGYFQDERYPRDQREQFLNGLRPHVLEPHPAFSGPGSHVAISFRLGEDYRKIGVCLPESYYRNALLRLVEDVRCPVVHVCADDGAAAFNLIREVDTGFRTVDHTGEGAIDQLRALASASRVVVANSSFAWWGAWLGDVLRGDGDRLVVCPERWGAGPESLPPARWTRVSL
jgi:hypothetical protein